MHRNNPVPRNHDQGIGLDTKYIACDAKKFAEELRLFERILKITYDQNSCQDCLITLIATRKAIEQRQADVCFDIIAEYLLPLTGIKYFKTWLVFATRHYFSNGQPSFML